MSKYRVKEIFGPTIQGEGAHAGRACVFLRFAACNLACTWCDTDFDPVGADLLAASEIVSRLLALDVHQSRMVVVTGGEPSLQWDDEIATAVRGAGFAAHMETNGTKQLDAPVDWLTVSPKPRFHPPHLSLVKALAANECKVVVDSTVEAQILDEFEARYDCEHWFLQPCDDELAEENLKRALALVSERPRWKLSLQLHKIVGVP